ncbi:MAG: ABC transporter substrate-binding protein, partial [Dehalococcoidia bacterium]
MSDAPVWARLHRRHVSRRAFLRAGGRAGVAAGALALVGCGGDDDAEAPESTSLAGNGGVAPPSPPDSDADTEQSAEVVTPTEPVEGGVAQLFAATEIHDRWDPHRSRFSQTQQFHSLMYSRLIRFDSVSEGTLEGDLTDLPETPDEETYIFTVRRGARFWDREPSNGRPFTAEDIRFNVQRQIDGLDSNENPDLLFFRQADYARTVSMDVQDDRTITLKTDGPDAT